MPSSSSQPRLNRRTVTLDSNKVVKDVATQSDVRIIRPQRQIEYQDPFLGHVSPRAVEGLPILPLPRAPQRTPARCSSSTQARGSRKR